MTVRLRPFGGWKNNDLTSRFSFHKKVKKHLASTPLLDFALQVEQVTTKKKVREPCHANPVAGWKTCGFLQLVLRCTKMYY